MRETIPKVFLLAYPTIDREEMTDALREFDAADWITDAESDAETLIEFMGKLCYRSFNDRQNLNLTTTRQSANRDYIQNLIKQGHGSVLSHANVSFLFANISRVFSHELVRHAVGSAFSQESLRYVRLHEIPFWMPDSISEDVETVDLFTSAVRATEHFLKKLNAKYNLDEMKFSDKKKMTSTLRRLLPQGMTTNIGWTVNFRQLRNVIEQRTSRHAEEEIRQVFQEVAFLMMDKFPNVFFDYKKELVDGIYEFTTDYRKV